MLAGAICTVIAYVVHRLEWKRRGPTRMVREAIERNRWRP